METIKGIALVALVAGLTTYISIKDPLHLNKGGIDGTSIWPALYWVIGIGVLYAIYRILNRKGK